jgi:acetylglutamate/LysW-gamma-L-alpha-aminoadipate kinase
MIVIKIGGTNGLNLDHACADAARMVRAGEQLVIVHGGSAETNALSERLGHPPRFVTAVSGFTSRYTDRATLEIFAMVTAGKINTLIVERLHRFGVNAFGLTGADGRLMLARRKEAIRIVEDGRQRILRDDYTGKIESVNFRLLNMLLNAGYVPVVAPLAISPQGDVLNVDGDRAAAMIAGALQARHLIILSNVPGLLRDLRDERSLIAHIHRAHIEQALDVAQGRMKKKVLGASEALALGVGQVVFADGRVEQPIRNALDGCGTVIA